MKRYFAFLLFSILFAVLTVGLSIHAQYSRSSSDDTAISATLTPVATLEASAEPVATPTPTSTPTPLPSDVKLAVPYTMQAPYNKWDALHEDACEEASLIMVKHYLDGTPIASKDQADKEITDLVHWEEAHGYGLSITLEQLNQIAHDYYGLSNGQIVQVSSNDDIKQELANGHPVILGMAGKVLPNPYFSNGGPNYHMLVAKGYDATGFVTNEPGTFRGDGFHYDYQPFYSAIHNWDPQNILNGPKAYLVFK